MLWFSLWHFPKSYKGIEPAFVDLLDDDINAFFSQNADSIQQEVLKFWKSKEISPYFNKQMVSEQNGYKTLSLRWWSIEFYQNQAALPLLSKWMSKRSDVLTLSINVLESKTQILPHMGDTNAIVRGHYGIQIPESLPACGIRVRNDLKSWKNNAWLWFTDAHEHETWNNSDQTRIVLLMDVLKPEYYKNKRYVCATVMTSQFIQKRMEKWSWIKHLPPLIIRFMARALLPLVMIRIWMLNFFKKY